MNKIVLVGRLVKDAEPSVLPGTGTGKMTFTLAVDRAYQKDKNNKKVDFIPCEQIGNHTTKLCQYMTKGKQENTLPDEFKAIDDEELPF